MAAVLIRLTDLQELVNYLNHIRTSWNDIIDQREELQPYVDYQTVELLQSRCPKASAIDKSLVVELMHSGKLFPLILDAELRSRLLRRIQESKHIIPTLHTFLEDTKWLEPCAKVLGRLLPKNHRRTIHRSLINCYTGAEQEDDRYRVEQSNLTFIERSGSVFQAAESGYRQLWLFAWRHFPELSATVPRKDLGKPKPKARASNQQRWQQLAGLAISLGFESEEIKLLNSQDPDSNMTYDFLSQVRPVESYHLPDEIRTARARQICQVLKSIERKTQSEPIPEPKVDGAIPVDHRCGRPHEDSHNCSKACFFLTEVYDFQASGDLSHFSVNRDIFLAFFGIESFLGATQEHSTNRNDRNSPHPVPTTLRNGKPRLTLQDFNFTRTLTGRVHKSGTTRRPANPQASSQPQSQNQQSQAHVQQAQSQAQSQPQSQSRSQAQDQPQSQSQQEHLRPHGGRENVWQRLQNRNRLQPQNLNSETEPDNTGVAIQEGHRGLKGSNLFILDLFQLYEEKCRLGDFFVVWIDHEAHRARGKHIPIDSGTISTSRVPPEDILSLAENNYFSVCPPSQGDGHSDLKCIEIKNIYNYVKGPELDGVVYAFRRGGEGVSLQRIQGESTKARLQELEMIARKRSRSSDGPRRKIVKKTQDDVDQMLSERNNHVRGDLNSDFVPPEGARDVDTESDL